MCEANPRKANAKLPLPKNLFIASDVSRLNSGGFSFADVAATETLYASMEATLKRTDLVAKPLIAGDAMRISVDRVKAGMEGLDAEKITKALANVLAGI